MNETTILFTLGDLTLTAYGLILTLGAAAAVILTVLLARKSIGADAGLSLCLAAIPGAVLGGRLVYVLTMFSDILYNLGGPGFIPQLWQGGYTLWGAVLGGAAGAWLYARATKRPVWPLLNLLAPGAALTTMAARFAEFFTSQGLGDYLESEAVMRFPFGVESAYGDWQIPVFFYEGVAAAVILCVVLTLFLRGGRSAEVFLILLGLTQIILESLREDEFIRFGFVRFNQLAAAVLLALVMLRRVLPDVRKNGWRCWPILRCVLYVAGIGVMIAIEFALDKSTINNVLLYAVMASALAVMGVALLCDGAGRHNNA